MDRFEMYWCIGRGRGYDFSVLIPLDRIGVPDGGYIILIAYIYR